MAEQNGGVKLNIGAGSVDVPGYLPIDRKLGREAYPLDYADDSVEEIRASHVLEHFGHREAAEVLRDWCRTLKPGGRIRIAVPDFDHIVAHRDDPRFEAYLFGGQTDENDFHKSVWTEAKLRATMEAAGIGQIRRWESDVRDCASLPVSLNLEGEKLEQTEELTAVKIAALMTHGRYGPNASRGVIEQAFRQQGIPLTYSDGVFYGQCMQRMMENVVDDVDIILTVDWDSLITVQQVGDLICHLVMQNQIDCLVALQPRRNNDTPLLTCGRSTSVETNGSPIKVTTAHFGLTAIRAENLRKVEKPWFFGEPDESGSWGEGRMDPDIWFWHQWRKAGYNVYVDPSIRIGHLEESAAYFDENLEIQRLSVPKWREKFLVKDAS